jgi:DNA-binding NarL/FixJ family response regulator
MPAPVQERAQIEEFWRSQLQKAENHYAATVAASKRVLEQFGEGDLVPPDGSLAVRNAHVSEAAARDEYMRVLRIFTDFTLYGKIPEASSVRSAPESETLVEPLTPRETEVLKLIATGHSSKQIAGLLGISFRTVQCHRSTLLGKLQAQNMSDLTRHAVRLGLVQL